jgi:hypothetical protein
MILPKERDPRFITIRRGGSLTDADHQRLALWAAACAEHVLPLFEAVQPDDPRPRQAIAHIRAWVRGESTMTQARAAGGHAMAAARALRGAARSCRVCRRPGGRRGPRGRARTGRRRLCHQGGAGGRAQGREPIGRAARMPVAAQPAARRQFASSSSTTSGGATPSAGPCSTADQQIFADSTDFFSATPRLCVKLFSKEINGTRSIHTRSHLRKLARLQ